MSIIISFLIFWVFVATIISFFKKDASLLISFSITIMVIIFDFYLTPPPTKEEIAAREVREKQAIALEKKQEENERAKEREEDLKYAKEEAERARVEQMNATLKALEEHPEVMNEYLREQADRY